MTGQITRTKRILEDKGIADEQKQTSLRIFPCQYKYSDITVHTKNTIALEESQSKMNQMFNPSPPVLIYIRQSQNIQSFDPSGSS